MMKKLICLFFLVSVIAFIIGKRNDVAFEAEATASPSIAPTVEITTTPSPVPTPEPTPIPAPEPTPEPTPEATPEPYPYQLEGYTAQQIGDYFCEVALAVEYNHGSGDSAALQKWKEPVYFAIRGEHTTEDVALINSFAEQLNEIEGFPGMYPAPQPQMENFTIRFLGREEMNADAGYVVNNEDAHGITLWDYYIDGNNIYNVRIWIRSDIDQTVRNSVILEEIVNSLGLGNDTMLRADSIIYQLYSEPQQLSDVDWLLMKLLYAEEMLCGMHEDECREVINQLFK